MSRFLPFLAVVVALSCSASGPGELKQNTDERLTSADAPPSSALGRLPTLATPRRYKVVLDVDPQKASYTGEVTVELDVPRPTRTVVLNARGLSVTRATADVGTERIDLATSMRKSSPAAEEDDELIVVFPRPVSGPVTVHVGYVSSYADGLVGLYRVKDGKDAYVFSQFEPMDARRAFPCFDEPSYKTPWDVVVRVPEGNVALANTREVSRKVEDDGKTAFVFATTEPLPSYLLAFAVGPLETLDAPPGGRVPVRVVTTRGKSKQGQLALDAARAQLDILEKYFDHPYPFDKLDLVAVPDFAAGAMENAGLLMFREDLILVDPKQPSANAERYIGLVLAHELAHQWFGNWVTMAWWDDLWLAEGFATWMESKVVDAWRPRYAARTNLLSDRSEALELDARPSARPVRRQVVTQADAEEAFDPIVYDKGASIVAMLEDWIGEEAFRSGVRAYLKQHARGSVRSEDLFVALTSASGKDVSRVAKGFVEQSGVPLVSVDVACEKSHAPTLILKQRMLTSPGVAPDERSWAIPFCVEYDAGKSSQKSCTLLEEPTAIVRLPVGECPKWIVPNASDAYARYALGRDRLLALAGRKAPLPPRVRFGMLESSLALVKSGDQGVDTLVALLEALRIPKTLPEDPEERVFVEKAISVLREMKKSLVVPVTERRFDDFSSQLLLPLAKQLGFEAREGESLDRRLLRRAVLDAAYLLVDDPWLREEARRRTRAFLKDPKSTDLDVASAALRIAARDGDAALFDDLLQRVGEPDAQLRNAILGALGSFSDPKLVERALDLLLDDRIKRPDGRYVIRQLAVLPSSNKVMLGWMARRQKDMKAKLPLFVRVEMLDAIDACDEESAAYIKKEIAPAFDGPEGGAYAATQAVERALQCAEIRAREADRMRKRFGFKL